MQGAQKLRSEAYLHVRCNDEVEAQRSRWTFYETIKNTPSPLTGEGQGEGEESRNFNNLFIPLPIIPSRHAEA